MTLAEKIAFHRKRRGWSQEELAEKLNVSRAVRLQMGRCRIGAGAG